MIKLAYVEPSKMFEELAKDPEYIRQKQELEEIQMLFGSNGVKSERNEMVDLLQMSEQGDKKLSPEVIQSLMMQSVMGNLTL